MNEKVLDNKNACPLCECLKRKKKRFPSVAGAFRHRKHTLIATELTRASQLLQLILGENAHRDEN